MTGDNTFVDGLCARDPQANRTRTLLLRLEREADKLGWDRPQDTGIFEVQHDPRTYSLEYQWATLFNGTLKLLADHNGGNVGAAFQALAATFEQKTSSAYEPHMPPWLRGAVRLRQPGVDLWDGDRPGFRFYGYGYRYEAWMVSPMRENDALTERLRREHRLDEHPQRVEVRQICLVTRDGWLWWVNRIRGQQPTVHAERPESETPGRGHGMGGGIVNGLSRLTNAVAGTPVPIWDAVPRAFRRDR